MDIITTPPGATIQINNDTKCTSNCRVNLAPGNYQVTAMLDGYDPAATGVTVLPGAPINVTLALQNQAQTVRIFTDLPSGKVTLDGATPIALQDGQLVLDRVKNGKHKITVTGPNNEATFSFNLVAGKVPTLDGAVAVNNLLAAFVGSFGASAHVESNSGPVKVSLNGQPQGETGTNGLDLKNVPVGDHQLTIGEGQDQRKMVVTFGPMPALTAYLKSDINQGTLVIATGEDDVTVTINGREYRRKTRRGQLRIPMVGPAKVSVAKAGFQSPPEQSTEVVKGEESKLAFNAEAAAAGGEPADPGRRARDGGDDRRALTGSRGRRRDAFGGEPDARRAGDRVAAGRLRSQAHHASSAGRGDAGAERRPTWRWRWPRGPSTWC